MQYLIILGLAAWLWLQRQRINTLQRRIGALELRVRDLAAAREPLVLDTPLLAEMAPQLDYPLTADNDPAPPQTLSRGMLMVALAFAALYVAFGFALAGGQLTLALSILAGAGIAAISIAAAPVLPADWGPLRTLAPGVALGIGSVLLIWCWPLAAVSHYALGPALVGVLYIALGAYAVRKRWSKGATFAILGGALVLGVAGYLRAAAPFAGADHNIYAVSLLLAFTLAVAAATARPTHHDRALVGCAGALSAALLVALAAFSRTEWNSVAAWAPQFAGAGLLAAAAVRAARDASDPKSDWAVTWWGSAALLLVLLGAHAAAPEALLPAAMAALATTSAYLFTRNNQRSLRWGALIAALFAALHGFSDDFINASFGLLSSPWNALAVLALATVLLYGAVRLLEARTVDTAELVRASAWVIVLTAAFLVIDHLADISDFTTAALRASALLVVGQFATASRDTRVATFAHWLAPGATIAGLGMTLYVCGLKFNPWWGYIPASIVGPPVFNALGLAFALPSLLAFASAGRWMERGSASAARTSLGVAIALALLWLCLEVRHGFHGATMANVPVGLAEAIVYAAIVIVAGLALRTRLDRERLMSLALGASERLGNGAFTAPTPQQSPLPGERRRRTRR